MSDTIIFFARIHPEGFTDTQLMDAIQERLWGEATRTLYTMALIDRTIYYDWDRDLYMERRK